MRPELPGANVSGRAVIGVTLAQSVWCKLNELNHPTQAGTFVYSSLLFNTEFNLLSLLVRALIMTQITDRCLQADMRQASICQWGVRVSCHNINSHHVLLSVSVCYSWRCRQIRARWVCMSSSELRETQWEKSKLRRAIKWVSSWKAPFIFSK